MPGVDWPSMTCKRHAATPAICKCLINIAQDSGLEQIVTEPTRGDNILDLVLTNNPTLINNAQSMPPLSPQADHNTVYVGMNIKPKVCKQPPRKVYKYNRADWDTIRDKVTSLSDRILEKESCLSTQELWDKTESGLQESLTSMYDQRQSKDSNHPHGLPAS